MFSMSTFCQNTVDIGGLGEKLEKLSKTDSFSLKKSALDT